MAWLNLTKPIQTVNYSLKDEKITLPQTNFFLKKQLIKFSCTFSCTFFIDPFHSAKLKKKIVRANPELWGCAIFLPKMAHLSWTKKFWYNPLLFLSSTYWSFSLCKILKIFCCGSRVMRMHHFWPKMIQLPKTIFFWKLLILFSSTYYLLSLGKILKKFFQQIQLWGCAIFGPRMAHFPKWEFF